MKQILIFILLFAIISPCFGQLTKEDVRQVVREELEPVKLDIAKMKAKMVTRDEFESVKSDVTEMKGKMATKDDMQELYRWIIAMWVTTILAVFAIPYLYGKADREKVKKLEVDVGELRQLRTEVETLKAIKKTAKRIGEENPNFVEAYRKIGLL